MSHSQLASSRLSSSARCNRLQHALIDRPDTPVGRSLHSETSLRAEGPKQSGLLAGVFVEKMKRTHMISLLAVLALVGAASWTTMTVKDQTYVESPPYIPVGAVNKQVAVVYYSRSGHSEGVAREVARNFNASISRIDADYPRSVKGQRKAISDAGADFRPPITVQAIDLDAARLVFLVSPTWMFGPAPPLWTYVRESDLSGKDVVLVTTGNSRFEQAETDAFAAEVKKQGGHFERHIFLRRGRIFWQKSQAELHEEARKEIATFR